LNVSHILYKLNCCNKDWTTETTVF